jgi:hypothetical protein
VAKGAVDPFELSDFGIYYPRGYLVVAFRSREDAERVRQDLRTGGYDPDDARLFTADAVARSAARDLEVNSGILARLGASAEAVQAHLKAAREGCTFLFVYAPGDLELERAMNVVRRVPFQLAHHYHRFAIHVLK